MMVKICGNLIDELLPLLHSEVPLIDRVLPGSRRRCVHLAARNSSSESPGWQFTHLTLIIPDIDVGVHQGLVHIYPLVRINY